ncbi:ABC transporter permease [Micromonospora sp. NBC_01412]|uniref:ABC transporter permease n=1 Tax=Micromonospora sp. NBC_01412 TaxID=2903590 RepID=UPI003250D898
MLQLIGRRLVQTLPTLLGITLLAFILVRMTGDPVATMLPPNAEPAEIDAFRELNGLDQPLPVQYFRFLGNAVTGDLGNSIRYGDSVTSLIADRLPATLELTAMAMAIAVLLGLPLGLVAGLRRGTWADKIGRTFALTGQALPSFYLGLLLIIVFGVWLGVLPTTGNESPKSFILPSITLAAALMPLIMRVSRGSLLDVLRQDYVRTARAKGTPEHRVLLTHMLRNSLIPVVTIVGMQLGAALSGAVVTETLFSWPGLGRLLVDSISTRDYPVVQAIVVFASAAFVLVNLGVDLISARIDPRIRLR